MDAAFLLATVGLGVLFSLGSPSVHRFFEVPKANSRAIPSAPGRRAPPPGDPGVRVKPAPLVPSTFWQDLQGAVRSDPIVVGFVPRNEGPRPLDGWNQPWVDTAVLAPPWRSPPDGFWRPGKHSLPAAQPVAGPGRPRGPDSSETPAS